ncbi:M23 family metallopeptidase [Streptomyces iconiensis]|uniref:M23 family metallopeptidase n=1 Tax=Streptomyces iconiensis TaxID=1384038 RepID=UPI0023619CBC|nr:M23 family metallopeptidase [Streptomyces iconiensis]
MNDRHPSGVPSPDDPGSGFSYGAYDANYGQSAYGTYGTGPHPADSYDGYATGSYGDEDPLFGNLPGSDGGTGTYAPTSWGTGTYATGAYDTGAYPTGTYDTGTYDTGAYGTGAYGTGAQNTASYDQSTGYGYPAPADGTGQWNFGVQDTGGWGTGAWDLSAQNAAYGYDEYGTQGDYAAHQSPEAYAPQGGGYEAQAGAGYAPHDTYGEQQPGHTGQFEQFGQDSAYACDQDATGQWSFAQQHEYDTADTWGFPDPASRETEAPGAAHDFDGGLPYDEGQGHDDGHAYDSHGYGEDRVPDHEHDRDHGPGYKPDAGYEPDAAPPAAVAPHSRGRRRSPKPRRRALMTVAVPSVAVMGVAGAAAATVMGGGDGEGDKPGSPAPVAAPDTGPVKPSAANNKLDSQLAGLSADADDFADRASRTQERIDLKQRQEAERERKAKEAARKEAMRPKYVIPVKDHTLSAHYGQAGVNWMSVHTGIDFPVSYGTSVMAATDGTVTTKYDMSYGNMAIVTAKDGTETWYCHLSSSKIRSGEVKAGDTIAYSGSSGNSTGPHLHFEVRPGGGSAVDPIPWLQDKGLNIS